MEELEKEILIRMVTLSDIQETSTPNSFQWKDLESRLLELRWVLRKINLLKKA